MRWLRWFFRILTLIVIGVPLLVVGGPRFDQRVTAQLGVDRIFGKGTTPAEVASYLVSAVAA